MSTENDFLVRVIEEYQAPYLDPIEVKMGDKVIVDLEKKTDIAGWVWCTNREGKSRWVPKAYVEIEGDQGKMLQDYNAIELTIHIGEVVKVHKAESSFYWVTNQAGEQGWISIANVEATEE